MSHTFPPAADPERLDTWVRYHARLCQSCQGTCCSLPVEVSLDDLIRLQLADEFERGEPLKSVAKRLRKQGHIEHFNHKQACFTLSRRATGDCLYLDPHSRRCQVYEQRPETCRNHPQIGPRPHYCAYRPR